MTVETSDEYLSKTTSAMEATAIAGLEWACVHDWIPRPDKDIDWITWMYQRVGELTVMVKAQRKEWIERGDEDLEVKALNDQRRRYFIALSEEQAGNRVFSAAEDSDDESLVEVGILTENKKPRLFKDGFY